VISNEEFLVSAQNRHFNVMRQAIQEGVDINAVDRNGNTALMYVALRSPSPAFLPICQELLAARADLNMRCANKAGWTPVMAAASFSCPEVVEWMLLNGADVNVIDVSHESEMSVIHHMIDKAINNRVLPLTNLFLKFGVQPSLLHKDRSGRTPSQLAQRKGFFVVSELLRQQEVDYLEILFEYLLLIVIVPLARIVIRYLYE